VYITFARGKDGLYEQQYVRSDFFVRVFGGRLWHGNTDSIIAHCHFGTNRATSTDIYNAATICNPTPASDHDSSNNSPITSHTDDIRSS
jgi:hypothetical protein